MERENKNHCWPAARLTVFSVPAKKWDLNPLKHSFFSLSVDFCYFFQLLVGVVVIVYFLCLLESVLFIPTKKKKTEIMNARACAQEK